MKTINLVVTEAVARAHSPAAVKGKPRPTSGIISINLPIDPSRCQTTLGAWLADRIQTTRFDDDLSRLTLAWPKTELRLSADEMIRTLEGNPLRCYQDLEGFEQTVTAWLAERRKLLAAYGDILFARPFVPFAWPVFGSAAAAGAESPEAYFDYCARKIRVLQPTQIRAWDGSEPPESLMRTIRAA